MAYSALPVTEVFMPACYRNLAFAPSERRYSDRTSLLKLCLDLLPTCGPCPVRARCIYQVRPRPSKFDGVAGGRIWFAGDVIATVDGADDRELPPPLKPRDICGTSRGIDEHYTRGERYCDDCRALIEANTEPVQLELADA
ncbi:hypothetical protein [Kitasatospora sp. MBT63]|uniref:hypothetical protein n=1 Tax=Kitasatospora sp. MBT63 TaxID=1444768 RepID=UPI00053A38DB|nr:hypothetical protein [Kitasatospora sp. MBT63]